MNKIKWVRPSGSEIETNDTEATVAYAEASGWTRAEDKPRRGRPPGSRNKPADNGDENAEPEDEPADEPA